MRNYQTPSETARKTFSAAMSDTAIASILRTSSISEADFNARMNVYRKAFANIDEVEGLNSSLRKMFAEGYAEADLQGTSQFDATILGNIKSFAGLLTIERALTQPNDYVSFLDVVGAYTGHMVDPNLGPIDYDDAGKTERISETLVAATELDLSIDRPIIPRSINLTVKEASAEYTITDDGKGNLLAPAGKLTAATVVYADGTVKLTAAVAGTITGTMVYDLLAEKDPEHDNVLTFRQGGTLVRTTPRLMMSRANLATAAAMGKSLGVDPMAYMAEALQNAIIHRNNAAITKEMIAIDSTNTPFPTIDFSSQSYDSYSSYADWFTAQFTDVDYALAKQSYKGVRAKAYLVAPDVAANMMKTEIRGTFVHDPEYNYINDLVGRFRGVPVLQHADVPTGVGYAVFKTDGGEAAPLVRGIYLPITPTPDTANYDNPTQVASGLYSQDAVKGIFPQLVKKFTVSGQMGN
jgi:hypothetical protein